MTAATPQDVLEGRARWCVVEGDCLALLPTLEGGCVDAVVTDPPYGIGFKYASHDDTPEGYGGWLWSILTECERLCRPGSPLFVWQAMLNVRRFAEWFPRDYRLFAAAKNFVQMRPQTMQHSWDPVVVWWMPGKQWFSEDGPLNRDFHIANSARHVSNTTALQRKHPCPRPLDQVEFIVRTYIRTDDLVLDPFCGSGTTGVACLRTGRRFIGVEIDPAYAAVARARLDAADPDSVPREGLFAGLDLPEREGP